MQTKNILLIFFLFLSFLAMAGNKAKNKEVYLQLFSIRDDIKKDFEGTIAKVAEIGYAGVEAANYADGKFYGLSPENFKKAIESTGMKVVSSHINKRLNANIADTDWDEVWAWWDVAIQAHKAAGIKYLVVPWMPRLKTSTELSLYCDYFNQIGEKCNRAGLRFGYHNHAFEFVEVEGELMYDFLLKNTDPKKVFFQMDVYWVVLGNYGPVDYFRNYPGRFELLHIKDDKELGQSGMVGFDAILNNISLAGTKYLVVEVEKYNLKPLESVKQSFDYIQQCLQAKSKCLKK